ncbi:unnamed protein product [Lactuca virosa]|uniref:Uncharacterized protein n=1 Tax=Lactuca virosa TaxID=75947 RepID=A0AAU9PBB0_9ASTR|nr:unnamed protein product [Lactuca virosa]
MFGPSIGSLSVHPPFAPTINKRTQVRCSRTLSRRRGVPVLIQVKKSKRNWQEKFLWVNNNLVVLSYLRTKVYVDHAPVLFGVDKELVDALEKISIVGEDWLDCFLAAGGMSAVAKLALFLVFTRCGGDCFFGESSPGFV